LVQKFFNVTKLGKKIFEKKKKKNFF
jgi:hypothetical protein